MDSTSHRPNFLSTACRTCNVVYASKIALEQHYVESPEHPNCTRCHIGFADKVARQDVSPFQVLFLPSCSFSLAKARGLRPSPSYLRYLQRPAGLSRGCGSTLQNFTQTSIMHSL